jgi:hypothetical protein
MSEPGATRTLDARLDALHRWFNETLAEIAAMPNQKLPPPKYDKPQWHVGKRWGGLSEARQSAARIDHPDTLFDKS